MFKKEMSNRTKPPTGVEQLIAPGCNPGIKGDYEIQTNPKGVELPRMKQFLSLVISPSPKSFVFFDLKLVSFL